MNTIYEIKAAADARFAAAEERWKAGDFTVTSEERRVHFEGPDGTIGCIAVQARGNGARHKTYLWTLNGKRIAFKKIRF